MNFERMLDQGYVGNPIEEDDEQPVNWVAVNGPERIRARRVSEDTVSDERIEFLLREQEANRYLSGDDEEIRNDDNPLLDADERNMRNVLVRILYNS